ncbi:MAG: YdiY family protein [Kiritimatiellia bacterium]
MKTCILTIACCGLLSSGMAYAQEAATNEVLPDVEPAAAEDIVIKPPKPVSPFKGSDMLDAFKGKDVSRFGVSGRVHKMPDKKSKKREKGCWRGKLDIGVSTASGNSDILRYDGSLTASKETEENYLFLKGAGRYGECDQEKDTENATGEAKYQHRLSDRMYSSLDGHIMHDGIADVSYRARGSLSLGRKFIWTDRTVLAIEAGPGYVEERKGGEETGFVAGRAAQYLEILITDSLQIWQSAEYVADITDSAVYFINAEVGLETVLVANMSLRFTVEDHYDSNPAEDKESNDLLTTTSFVWNF